MSIQPIQYHEELAYCPVRPWYRHKWGRAKVVSVKTGGVHIEILRCRRCTAYIVVKIILNLESGDPERHVQFVKTTNFETLSEWDTQVRHKL